MTQTNSHSVIGPEDSIDERMLSDLPDWLRATDAEIASVEQRHALDEERLRKLRVRRDLITRLQHEEERASLPVTEGTIDRAPQAAISEAGPINEYDGLDAAVEAELQDRGITTRQGEAAVLAAVEAVLSRVKSVHYRKLAELVGPHVHLGGRDRANTLIAYLSKASDRFARVQRGTYALRIGPKMTSLEREAKLPKKRRRKIRRRKVARALAELTNRNGQ